jgi:hypothetical protein
MEVSAVGISVETVARVGLLGVKQPARMSTHDIKTRMSLRDIEWLLYDFHLLKAKSPVEGTGEAGMATWQAVPTSFPRECGGTGLGGRPDLLAQFDQHFKFGSFAVNLIANRQLRNANS